MSHYSKPMKVCLLLMLLSSISVSTFVSICFEIHNIWINPKWHHKLCSLYELFICYQFIYMGWISVRLNRCPGGADLQAEGWAGQVWWLVRTRMWFCQQALRQLQQALDGLCQVMVWYQLAGLQGRAAKSHCLAHKHKRKQTQQLQLLGSLGRVKLTYIIISLKIGLQPGRPKAWSARAGTLSVILYNWEKMRI